MKQMEMKRSCSSVIFDTGHKALCPVSRAALLGSGPWRGRAASPQHRWLPEGSEVPERIELHLRIMSSH
jgi:hypothetical protein